MAMKGMAANHSRVVLVVVVAGGWDNIRIAFIVWSKHHIRTHNTRVQSKI